MALTKKLEAIGDSIRSKTGSTEKMTLDEMKDAIDGIGSVPAPPDEAFVITGDCRYRFAFDGWKWFLNQYGDKITTKDITSATYMFSNSADVSIIPFDLNSYSNSNKPGEFNYAFYYCKITKPPYIKGLASYFSHMFNGCMYLTEIPEDWANYIDWSYIHNSGASDNQDSMFEGCRSLRHIPTSLIKELYTCKTQYYYQFYSSMCSSCYVLENLNGLNTLPTLTITSNLFSSMVNDCHRLSSFTFETDNGIPHISNWNKQLIDLTRYVGYAQDSYTLTTYSGYHGITRATLVTNDTNYQALKNNPDWWTANIAYSRYNHDSAVETINSLPDTSEYLATAGGTNTIKFKGAAGSKTDGGAINTLTEEEIAVATAKGWTVTLV